MKRVLVVAVHPDDETLGVGGTILKHISQGDEVTWLIVTQSDNYSEAQRLKRESVIIQVAQNYGVNKYYNLKYNTTKLDTYPLGDLVASFSAVINEVKPQIIYLPFKGDVHSDHRIVFNTVYSCTKNFRYPFVEKILMVETLSETDFAPALNDMAFIPNVFVDITEFFGRKIEIMKLYDTEIMEPPLPRSLRSIEALAVYRGTRIGVNYAEAFMLVFEKQ